MALYIGERLDEIIQFDFSKPHTSKVRAELSVKLCDQYLAPLTEIIEKSKVEENTEEEEDDVEDKLGLMDTLENYLKGDAMNKMFHLRNLKCNAVLPFISALPVPDWEKRDLAVVVSFGFPKTVPGRLRARQRSNAILTVIESHIDRIFSDRKVTDVEHNKDAKVPHVLCDVNDVSVIIKISIKPFCSPQFMAKDVVDNYKKFDDRFITIANYFHSYLKAKVVNKKDERKAKSVIPRLRSLKMMVIHFFKHYKLLPADLETLEGMICSLSLDSEKKPISLGTLYFLFLDYYLDVVSLEDDYLEVTTGEVFEKKSIGLTNLNILSISDIFDDHIPGERVNDTLIFKRILKASFVIIQRFLNNRTGDVLNNLRVIPLRPRVEL
ncbi:unnamed protein product [Caenorhabditis sp. 36 PRJEB53466]|nr:unnamed protein product [Caenorhabditis sp. 36 PRJEB53466]